MMSADSPSEDKALDRPSAAPEKAPATDARQHAGQDKSITKRLAKHPDSPEAQLDNALDESMDASDPPSTTQPGGGEPAPSSGFDASREEKRSNAD